MSDTSRENNNQLQRTETRYSESSPTEENLALEDNLQDSILARLNDDCLIQIFEYLPLTDLVEVADVCRTFESDALSVFRRKYVNLDLAELLDGIKDDRDVTWDSDESFGDDIDKLDLAERTDGSEDGRDVTWNAGEGFDLNKSEPSHIELLPMNLVEKLFRHFGMYIRTVDLSGEYDDDQKGEIFQLMATYCAHDDAELEKLTMSGVSISQNVAVQLQPVLDRLTSLDITDGPFRVGSELTELILENVTLDRFVNRRLNKLQSLSLRGVTEKCRGSFKSLLMASPRVKRLIVESKGLPSSPKLTETAGALDELEELQIDALSEPVNEHDVLQYHRLKLFKLDCMWYSKKFLNNFIQQNLSIEELYLSKLTISPNVAEHLAKLSNVKKISLVEGGWGDYKENSVQLTNIVKGMPNLEKIFLCDFGRVTIDDIKAIVTIAPKLTEIQLEYHENETLFIRTKDFNEINGLIANRVERTKLHLNIRGNDGKQSVRDRVICKNSTWLEVNVVNFIPNHREPVNIINFYGFNDDGDSSISTLSSDDSDGTVYSEEDYD